MRTGRRGGRGGDGIPANPKELKGGSANDGVPSLSLISIFDFLSVRAFPVTAMSAICLLPYIAICDRGEARAGNDFQPVIALQLCLFMKVWRSG